MSKYVLPDLAYDYAALEPHISARIMELHHDKHHQAYVDGANKAIEMIEAAREDGDLSGIGPLEQSLAFNLSGHVLHSLFWQNLSPDGGEPPRELAEDLNRDFGSFQGFKEQMSKTAATIMGSGWAALMWDPLADRLLTVQIHDHHSNTIQGGIPLMVLDAWEHAYYLQYANEKAKFFDAVWNVWNWNDIGTRYAAARQFDLQLNRVSEKIPQGKPGSGGLRAQSPSGRA